jgi:hypothetical protein
MQIRKTLCKSQLEPTTAQRGLTEYIRTGNWEWYRGTECSFRLVIVRKMVREQRKVAEQVKLQTVKEERVAAVVFLFLLG